MMVAAICTALLGLLVFGLGLAVSMTRGTSRVNFGYRADPTDRLYKIVRAHGNTAEYAPMLAVLMLLIGSREPAPWMLWTMAAVTLCRYLIVAGLLLCPSLDRPHPLRFLCALGTYVGGLVLCAAAVIVF
jgi:uncharacterized protein